MSWDQFNTVYTLTMMKLMTTTTMMMMTTTTRLAPCNCPFSTSNQVIMNIDPAVQSRESRVAFLRFNSVIAPSNVSPSNLYAMEVTAV